MLVFGAYFPDEVAVLQTLRQIKERLNKVSWNIKVTV